MTVALVVGAVVSEGEGDPVLVLVLDADCEAVGVWDCVATPLADGVPLADAVPVGV